MPVRKICKMIQMGFFIVQPFVAKNSWGNNDTQGRVVLRGHSNGLLIETNAAINQSYTKSILLFFFTSRNIGMGSSTSAGRVGSFTSPYIVHLVSKYCGILFGPVHTTESRKRSFSKTLFKPEEFEKPALYFSVDRKRFESDAIWKRWGCDNHYISQPEF